MPVIGAACAPHRVYRDESNERSATLAEKEAMPERKRIANDRDQRREWQPWQGTRAPGPLMEMAHSKGFGGTTPKTPGTESGAHWQVSTPAVGVSARSLILHCCLCNSPEPSVPSIRCPCSSPVFKT
ncbi:unnamed protein product [Lampetra fluviatilis]